MQTNKMKKSNPLKFKVGQQVTYKMLDRIYFTGIIINAERRKGLKPYTIKLEDGKLAYANEEFLEYCDIN